jgi:protein TonB
MSSALAQADVAVDDVITPYERTGAQSILAPPRARPAYWPQAAALTVYAALIGLVALHQLSPSTPPEEEAVELVMLPPPVAEEPPPPAPEEPPPPVAEEPPPPDEPPPPQVAKEPPVAPVQPKPIPKPPKPKVVEHKPVEPRPVAPPPPNAVPSGYFNQVASRVARIANSNPLRGPGRVGYRIVISPSGSVISASISSSGRPDLDAAARRAIAGPFPAFRGARPVAISGGVRYQ